MLSLGYPCIQELNYCTVTDAGKPLAKNYEHPATLPRDRPVQVQQHVSPPTALVHSMRTKKCSNLDVWTETVSRHPTDRHTAADDQSSTA
jgi:hypothetical protein